MHTCAHWMRCGHNANTIDTNIAFCCSTPRLVRSLSVPNLSVGSDWHYHEASEIRKFSDCRDSDTHLNDTLLTIDRCNASACHHKIKASNSVWHIKNVINNECKLLSDRDVSPICVDLQQFRTTDTTMNSSSHGNSKVESEYKHIDRMEPILLNDFFAKSCEDVTSVANRKCAPGSANDKRVRNAVIDKLKRLAVMNVQIVINYMLIILNDSDPKVTAALIPLSRPLHQRKVRALLCCALKDCTET